MSVAVIVDPVIESPVSGVDLTLASVKYKFVPSAKSVVLFVASRVSNLELVQYKLVPSAISEVVKVQVLFALRS